MVVNSATTEIKDLDCRARISAPIVEMSFAPNGRFLACFTEFSMLTVISTTFETKVLDFDTSEGSSQPPLEMKWCGEDRYVGCRSTSWPAKDQWKNIRKGSYFICYRRFMQCGFALEELGCIDGRPLWRLVAIPV